MSEELLRAAHASLAIRWGTTDPFAIGKTTAERVGYADIRCTRTTVHCRDESVSALVPIVRQRVFGELAERGWDNDAIEFSPTVGRGRVRFFVDENESSPTYGKRKRGVEYTFHFEMRRELAVATFQSFGTFKPLPQKES